MTTLNTMILDTARQIFNDLSTPEVINAAERGVWPAALWQAVTESGLALTWVPEENGGVGASMLDGFALIKAAGESAVPIPLAETLLSGWLLAQAGLQASGAAATIALGNLSLTDGKLCGSVNAVPGARNAQQIVTLVSTGDTVHVVQVSAEKCVIRAHTNLAGEPWDQIDFNNVKVEQLAALPKGIGPESVKSMGALVRCVQAAGALSAALELSIDYSMERVQFGRPIGNFQALQQSIASFAGEVASINAAADAAAEAVDRAGGVDHDAWIEIATAKILLEESVNLGAAVAHQVHGAMGFTYEHRLQQLTRRLWSWRDEYGSDVTWSQHLGDEVLKWGADSIWPKITAVTDARL